MNDCTSRSFTRSGVWTSPVLMLSVLTLLLAFWLPAGALADAAALLKEANSAYRSAETAFFTGKFESARESLDKARELTDKALAEDPNNVQAQSLNNRVRTLTDRLTARVGGASQPTPAVAVATEPTGPVALPSGANVLLRDIDRKLDEIDRLLSDQSANLGADYRQKASRAALQEAKDHMATLRQRHEARLGKDHPELVARQQRLDAAPARLDAFDQGLADAAAGREQTAATAAGTSGPWVEKLRPYVLPAFRGGDPEKYLIPSATMEREEMQKRLGIYASATADLRAYRAATVASKTDELAEIEKELAQSLENFEDSLAQYGRENKTETQRQMEQWKAFAAEQKAKIDRGEPFILPSSDALPDLRRRIDEAAMFVEAGDPEIASLEKELEELRKVDFELRKKRIADTRHGREQYAGDDKPAIVKMAADMIMKKKSDARILRTVVLPTDWKEEARWEYTDTTRSAMRYRVTRSVTVEVATKSGTDVTLHTLDVSKDRRTDGTWGELYGHIMYERPMLEENVSK